MKTMLAGWLVLAASSTALAQGTTKDELFKGVKMGDRVEITLKTEFAIRGKLVQSKINDDGKVELVVDESVDVSKLDRIILDVRDEYPDLTGEMGVERINIKATRKLRALTKEEAEAIAKQREALLEETKKADDARRARSAKDDQGRIEELEAIEAAKREKEMDKDAAELKKKAEALEKAASIYKKFPPPQWGPQTMQEIGQKALLKQPLTPEQLEFSKNFDAWTLYDQYIKAKKEKEKDPPK
jgi:hypothetical protein